jgi:hypothetical protein
VRRQKTRTRIHPDWNTNVAQRVTQVIDCHEMRFDGYASFDALNYLGMTAKTNSVAIFRTSNERLTASFWSTDHFTPYCACYVARASFFRERSIRMV